MAVILGRLEAVLGRLETVLGRLGAILGRLGAMLGPSWAVLGPAKACLGQKPDHGGTVLGCLRAVLRYDRTVMVVDTASRAKMCENQRKTNGF